MVKLQKIGTNIYLNVDANRPINEAHHLMQSYILIGDTAKKRKIELGIIDKDVAKVQKQIESVKMSARQAWSYGNQLVTMMMNNLERVAGDTEKTAWIQRTLATASVVQQEIAFRRLMLEAFAAFGSGNPVIGSMLLSIAGLMQSSMAASYGARMQSITAEQQAAEIRRQVESYRR